MPFLVGGVFGLVAMQLRQWLHETPVFAEMQARKALSEELPLKTVLKKHKAAVALSMFVTWFLAISIVVAILMRRLICKNSSACRRWTRCAPTAWPSSR